MARSPISRGNIQQNNQPVIIRKKRRRRHREEAHGGAWKIALADFMTAMMAFFMLMWLVNITTQEERETIAMWYNPMAVKESKTASDGVLSGKELDTEGTMNSTFAKGDQVEISAAIPEKTNIDELTLEEHLKKIDEERAIKAAMEAEKIKQEENEVFFDVMEEIRQKISAAVDMHQLAENIIIEVTEEGLRIQITDRDKIPMFPVGSTGMTSDSTKIIKAIGDAVKDVKNNIAITGHTDSLGYKDSASFDNWDLSAGRANSARRILTSAGVESNRISRVEGLADKDNLIVEDSADPRNRRISVTLLRKK